MKNIIEEQFDVVVIGSGPAGMMAAIRAAKKKSRVALIDKKEEPGKKLLMTGGGRCNITQEESDVLKLSNAYKNGRFLLSSLNAFKPQNVRDFFAKLSVPSKVEKNGKVYPQSDKAQDVLDALYKLAKENGITFFYGTSVVGFEMEGESNKRRITKVKLKKRELIANNIIIATGGMSYPTTGSMGEGFQWAKEFGHKIIEPKPALVPIKVKEDWAGELQGVSAHNVSLGVYVDGKKKIEDSGDLMFAHYGFSGPLALNISREINKLLTKGEKFKLVVDFKPYLNFEKLDEIVRSDLEKNASKNLANCLTDLFSHKLLDFLLRYSGLDLEKHAAKISKKERHQLVNLFKHFEFTFDGLFGYERAMVTAGGVSTKEIDSKTMRSKIIENLFFAGEIMDADGPTGGYNLQMCWSTGFVAGENAAKNNFEL